MPDGPRRSLFARLAVVLLVLLVGVGAVWVVTTLVTTGLYQEELEQRLNRDLARSLLADTAILERSVGEEIGEGVDGGLGPDLEPDLEPELEHIFHTLMVVNPRIEVYLLDVEGHILAFSAPEGRVVREQVSIDPVHAFLAGERRLPIRGDDPRQEAGVKIFSAAPIEAPGVTSALKLAAAIDTLEPGDGAQWLMRCDSVAFPPGGCAYTHVHQGPGIRCLHRGNIRIDCNGHSAQYGPGGAWFEAGPDPVFAQADAAEATRFIRVMILPRRLEGQSSIRYVNADDADKPKLQKYTIYVDEFIDI